MATITLSGVLLTGNHASRPAATAVGSGALYSCTTHSLIYQSDGATWSTWASLAGTGGTAATTPVTTTDETGSVAASVSHPEFQDGNLSGATNVSMAGAGTGTGVTANSVTGMAGRVVYTNASYQYWDVASAVGTGDFDLRCRITSSSCPLLAGTSTGLLFFGVTDSGRTSTTGLYTRVFATNGSRDGTLQAQAYTGLGTSALSGVCYWTGMPQILRVKRVTTTVTRYISFNEGLSWVTLGNDTSSLNVAKVGVWGNPNGNTSTEVVVHWVRSF